LCAKEKVRQINLLRELDSLVDKIEKEGYSRKEILKIIEKKEAVIPYSIFSNEKLSPLETITKYLRENLGYKYAEIANLLGRNPLPIGITYRNAVHKMKEGLDISSKEGIPASIINNKELSVFESIVYYLKKKDLKFSEIAKILNRDDRTIWTVYHRAVKKKGGKK
jgi:hypothetical protein